MPIFHQPHGELYYETHGDCAPPLIFIHGLTLDHRMWQEQVAAFAPRYRVITYDCRGFGKSSIPTEQDYNHADDLAALMDFLHIERAVIAGLSMGGRILSQMAVRHPTRIAGLIFIDSGLDGFHYSEALNQPTYVAIQNIYNTQGLDAAKHAWLAVDLFAPARRSPSIVERLHTMVADYSGWHWQTKLPATPPITPPARTQLSTIAAPTLIIIGELDAPDFQIIANILHTEIPSAQKIVLPNTGHLSNLESPTLFNATVEKFLQDIVHHSRL